MRNDEYKYTVFVDQEIEKYLTDTEKQILLEIREKISLGQIKDKKPDLEYYVIPSDDPRFEDIRHMLERPIIRSFKKKR